MIPEDIMPEVRALEATGVPLKGASVSCAQAPRSEAVMEWVWNNCTVVCYPAAGQYPIEHNLSAKKDMREVIERYASRCIPPNARGEQPAPTTP
jgi:hypothetical protein